MATLQNDKRNLRFSLADLEAMRTHELAELLSNFVLLLRRLPDVPFSELAHQASTPGDQGAEEAPGGDQARPTGPDLVGKAHNQVNGHTLPDWSKQQ